MMGAWGNNHKGSNATHLLGVFINKLKMGEEWSREGERGVFRVVRSKKACKEMEKEYTKVSVRVVRCSSGLTHAGLPSRDSRRLHLEVFGEEGGEVSLGNSLQPSNNACGARDVLEVNGKRSREYHYAAIWGAVPCSIHWALLIV